MRKYFSCHYSHVRNSGQFFFFSYRLHNSCLSSIAGNPRVTPEVTRDVCLLARMMAANLYYSQIDDLMFEVLIAKLHRYMCRLLYSYGSPSSSFGIFVWFFELIFLARCPCGVAAMSFVLKRRNSTNPQREMQSTT